jgi:AcrR family transcriptional regulator
MAKKQRRTRPASSVSILEGALRAMARRGVQKVSIDDICLEAQVSKRTLYRYFDGRGEVIAAIAEHISTELAAALKTAVEVSPALDKRVGVVTGVLIDYAMSSETARLSRSEAEFIRTSLNKSYDSYRELVRGAIAPIFADRPDLAAAGLTSSDLAELILRLSIEALLMPDHARRKVADTLSRYWQIVDNAARLGGTLMLRSLDDG